MIKFRLTTEPALLMIDYTEKFSRREVVNGAVGKRLYLWAIHIPSMERELYRADNLNAKSQELSVMDERALVKAGKIPKDLYEEVKRKRKERRFTEKFPMKKALKEFIDGQDKEA